jgi:hypothetical protein
VKRFSDPQKADVADRQERSAESATAEWEIDQILADSFPASDAPPWTLGVTETPPKNDPNT